MNLMYNCKVCGHSMVVPAIRNIYSEGSIVSVRRSTEAQCCGRLMTRSEKK